MKRITGYIQNCLACKSIFASLLFILLFNAVDSYGQTDVQLKGRVIDGQTREPVPYVHIYTQSLSHGTTTDEQGYFNIMINPKDTLVFSAVGFDKYLFSLKQEEIRSYYEVVIEMDFKSYQLEPVKVTAYKDIESFKQDVLKLDIPTEKKNIELQLPGVMDYTFTGDEKMVIRGPITALYNKFSKEARERRKLEAFKKQTGVQKIIDSKYNIEVVKNVTKLNEEGARRFMEWCRFEEEFLIKATEYELTVAMLKCLEEFPKPDTVR